ncbi:DUF4189 domain-containing protein [Pseudoroseomonas cervicalis]|uniref:DUF4189 domain-containing protein n=1 Tax=Teichococcus cervicalis TaxID=204525 RepID=UPI0027805023|nr:DUF4189 domain-containing protein [Pseudoroseomonas cervicalis]MDQ1080844.1 hypothetical protein [Pseudoroseomonas cervicalis]
MRARRSAGRWGWLGLLAALALSPLPGAAQAPRPDSEACRQQCGATMPRRADHPASIQACLMRCQALEGRSELRPFQAPVTRARPEALTPPSAPPPLGLEAREGTPRAPLTPPAGSTLRTPQGLRPAGGSLPAAPAPSASPGLLPPGAPPGTASGAAAPGRAGAGPSSPGSSAPGPSASGAGNRFPLRGALPGPEPRDAGLPASAGAPPGGAATRAPGRLPTLLPPATPAPQPQAPLPPPLLPGPAAAPRPGAEAPPATPAPRMTLPAWSAPAQAATAPPAAAPSPPGAPGARFGAIYLAAAPSARYGLVAGQADRIAAHRRAEGQCMGSDGTPCRLVLEFQERCGSIAHGVIGRSMVVTDDPSTYLVMLATAASGRNPEESEREALADCRLRHRNAQCRVVQTQCGPASPG